MSVNPPQMQNLDMAPRVRSATFVPESYSEKDSTIDFIASTGAEGVRFDRKNWEYFIEELELTEEACDLSRLQNRCGFFKNHDSDDIDEQIGTIVRAWIEDGKLMIRVWFDKEDEQSLKYLGKFKRGFLNKVSIGYTVQLYHEITREDDKIKRLIARKWQPHEVSAIGVAFDDDSQSRSFANKYPTNILPLENKEVRENKTMPTENKTPENNSAPESQAPEVTRAAAPTPAPTVNAEDVLKAERARTSEINSLFEKHGSKIDNAKERKAEFMSNGESVENVRAFILDNMSERSSENETNSVHVDITRDERDTKMRSIESAILNRLDSKNELVQNARNYQNLKMLEVARELLGGKYKNAAPVIVARAALKSSDFGIIAGNVVHKQLMDAYQTFDPTWQIWADEAEFSDLKSKIAFDFTDASSLDPIAEGAAYPEGVIGEKGETYKLSKFGKIIRLTDELFINDDLDALAKLPRILAMKAHLNTSKIVYGVLTGSHVMADTVELFDAAHNNLAGTGAVPAEATITALVNMITGHKDASGDPIFAMPKYIVSGPANRQAIEQYMSTDIRPTKAADARTNTNLERVYDQFITGNEWYVIGDKNSHPTVEVGYLQGMREPLITEEPEFTNDTLGIKVKHFRAAKAVSHIGMAKNPGA